MNCSEYQVEKMIPTKIVCKILPNVKIADAPDGNTHASFANENLEE